VRTNVSHARNDLGFMLVQANRSYPDRDP
jgi:hypothetical protein